jgi:predicted dithiol-disulfide oxidoreductase (DUF899 family)
MELPPIVSEEEWQEARDALLVKEKKLTHARDAMAAERRRMPRMLVEKEYEFEGPNGRVSLLDMFEGRRQLIVQHFMFDPEWEDGCPSCTYFSEDLGHLPHLHEKDTSFVVISRAPLQKIEAYKRKKNWTFPWYSSFGSDFNYDFHVTMDESVTPAEYNYRSAAEHRQAGMPWFAEGEQPGVSVFLREGERVFHTYSAFARGSEHLVSTAMFLDLTPLGRQEG